MNQEICLSPPVPPQIPHAEAITGGYDTSATETDLDIVVDQEVQAAFDENANRRN